LSLAALRRSEGEATLESTGNHETGVERRQSEIWRIKLLSWVSNYLWDWCSWLWI